MSLCPWPHNEECLRKNSGTVMETEQKQNTLNKKENRRNKNKKVANLIFGYVFLPLVVCFFVLILKLLLLSSISFKIAETWIFQTLLDHWLECCLLSIINLNFLIRFKRDQKQKKSCIFHYLVLLVDDASASYLWCSALSGL